jgi:hypothetical protein
MGRVHTLFKIAASMTKIPREKIKTSGTFFCHGRCMRRNIGSPIASITQSEVRLKTAFVIR